jgi:hypothetical protein|tara:strand:+ start:340 stop:1464 length:1125 start_codon:yes stop_codon:yes gene_type:complete
MANQNLITGAGIAADKFVNPGTSFTAGAAVGSQISDMARIAMQQNLYQKRQDEVEMKNYVNSFDGDQFNVAKVEESMRPEVNDYLIKSRNEYSEAAKLASKLDAEDPRYAEAIATMNRINNSFENLSTGLDGIKNKRTKFYEDVKNNTISEASDVSKLNSLYKDPDFDIVIGPSGDITLNHNGEYVALESFDDDTEYNYFLVNNEGFNNIMTLTNKAQNGAAKIEGGLEQNYQYQLNQMFNTMGREDMESMLYDTVISDTPLNLRPDFDPALLDIENDQALRKWLSNTYLQSLKTVAKGSYDQKRAEANRKISDAARRSRKIAEAKQKVNESSTSNFDLSTPEGEAAATAYLIKKNNDAAGGGEEEVTLPLGEE